MYGLSFVRRNRRKLTKVAIGVAALLIVLALAALLLCSFFGIHSRRDILGYRMMMHEHYHPIWKDLAWRRIKKGDSLESLLQRHPALGREDYGPYTNLRYGEWTSFDGLNVLAKEGKLIAATAWSCTWRHIFFEAPEEEEALRAVYSAYVQQKRLESQAFRIHRVITGGQDVFFARLIERREVPDHSSYSQEMMEQLKEIYGQEYLDTALTRPELTVEVTKVVYGDLQVGAVLTFAGDDCGDALRGEPEPMFLHLDDMRLIYHPQYPARELYTTVPRKALDWYQSLTAEQVKDLEARCLAERAERQRQEEEAARKYRETGKG